MTLVQTLTGHSSYVWRASFTLNNSYVVTCSSDETARVWNVSGGATASVYYFVQFMLHKFVQCNSSTCVYAPIKGV